MDENIGRNFSPLNVSGCTSTTSAPMDKWMPQADSAHQIGLKPTLQGILIVVESGGPGGRINAAGIFHSQKFDSLLLIPQQPVPPWTNGCYGWIQQVRKVQK